jgi:hypothetical protein
MRHEQNAAIALVDGLFKVFDAFGRVSDLVRYLEQIPVQKNMGEIMKLSPGAPEMKNPIAMGIQGLINPGAAAHPAGEKKKIARRHKPGKHQKNPAAPFLG